MNFGPMDGFCLTTWDRLIPDWQAYEGGDLELVLGVCASDLMIVRSRIRNILQIPATNLQIGVLWSVRLQWGKNPLWRKIKRQNLSLHVGCVFPSINHDKIVCVTASPSERIRIFPKGWKKISILHLWKMIWSQSFFWEVVILRGGHFSFKRKPPTRDGSLAGW